MILKRMEQNIKKVKKCEMSTGMVGGRERRSIS